MESKKNQTQGAKTGSSSNHSLDPMLNCFLKQVFDYFEKNKVEAVKIKDIKENKLSKPLKDTWEEIPDQIKKDLSSILQTNPNIHFNEKKGELTKKKKYEISNKEDLKNLIERHDQGIDEESNLLGCYSTISEDIKDLDQSKAIRRIQFAKDSKHILFPTYEKYDRNPLLKDLPEKFKNDIIKLLEEISNTQQRKKEDGFTGKATEKVKKKKNKRNKVKIVNNWVLMEKDFEDLDMGNRGH